MKVITWNRSFKGLSNNDDGKDDLDNEEFETHATVLDKLLAWEKKLYDEVKVKFRIYICLLINTFFLYLYFVLLFIIIFLFLYDDLLSLNVSRLSIVYTLSIVSFI